MQNALRAAIKASIATAICAAAAKFVMALRVIGLIVIMLPLWWLDGMGIRGLGHAENGFFDPTRSGYIVGAALVWLAWFSIFLVVRLKRSKSADD